MSQDAETPDRPESRFEPSAARGKKLLAQLQAHDAAGRRLTLGAGGRASIALHILEEREKGRRTSGEREEQ